MEKDDFDKEIETLLRDAFKPEDIFKSGSSEPESLASVLVKYQRCVNHIEDYFEYMYKNHDKEQIKKSIMDKIIRLSDSIQDK
jgi:hypothetical protein